MSYELSGLGVTRPKMVKTTVSKLQSPNRSAARIHSAPGATFATRRRAQPHQIFKTVPRLPAGTVYRSHLSGLGFSLKPPRWLRKVAKKVAKPLLIGAAVVGASFIPGVAPLIGKAGGLLAKGVMGGAKMIASKVLKPMSKSFVSVIKKTVEKKTQAVQEAANQAAQEAANRAAQEAANQAAQEAANRAAQQAASQTAQDTARQPEFTTPTYDPSNDGSSTPDQAGMGSSAFIPIGLGLVALIAVSGALKRGRK